MLVNLHGVFFCPGTKSLLPGIHVDFLTSHPAGKKHPGQPHTLAEVSFSVAYWNNSKNCQRAGDWCTMFTSNKKNKKNPNRRN